MISLFWINIYIQNSSAILYLLFNVNKNTFKIHFLILFIQTKSYQDQIYLKINISIKLHSVSHLKDFKIDRLKLN